MRPEVRLQSGDGVERDGRQPKGRKSVEEALNEEGIAEKATKYCSEKINSEGKGKAKKSGSRSSSPADQLSIQKDLRRQMQGVEELIRQMGALKESPAGRSSGRAQDLHAPAYICPAHPRASACSPLCSPPAASRPSSPIQGWISAIWVVRAVHPSTATATA